MIVSFSDDKDLSIHTSLETSRFGFTSEILHTTKHHVDPLITIE